MSLKWENTVLSWDNKVPLYQNSALGPIDIKEGYKCHYEVSADGTPVGYPGIHFTIMCREGGTSPSIYYDSMIPSTHVPLGWSYAAPSVGWNSDTIELSIDVTIKYQNLDIVPQGEYATMVIGAGSYGSDDRIISPPQRDKVSATFYTQTGYGPFTHTQHFDITADTVGSVGGYASQAIVVAVTGASNNNFRVFPCYTAEYDYKRYDYT